MVAAFHCVEREMKMWYYESNKSKVGGYTHENCNH